MTQPTPLPAASYDGTIERTAEGGVIRYVRHLPYSVAAVWDAVTNPERLADWWLPFDADITVDLREGGELTFQGRGEEPFSFSCEILRVDAPVLLEHTHGDPGSVMRWELEAEEAGTVLRLSHFVTDVQGAIDRCFLVGLNESLRRLEPMLSGAPIAWDDDEFAAAQAHYATLGLAPAP